MKFAFLILIFFGLTSFETVANIERPTCEEEPTRRDCIKVEEPNANPPKHTIKKSQNLDQNQITRNGLKATYS